MENGCAYEFSSDYRSYCHTHFDSNTLNSDQIYEPDELCAICALPMGDFDRTKSLQLICCLNDSWYHKQCLKQQAFTQKDEFQCPLCESVSDFRDNMLSNGIFIPDNAYLSEFDPEIEIAPKPKRRRVHQNWIFVETFASKAEAIAAIEAEGCWSYIYENKSANGKKVNYRCNLMKFRGKQCAAGVYLLYDSENGSVHFYRADAAHTHENDENKENAVSKISGAVEAEIRKMFEQKQKPKSILYELVRQKLTPPSKPMLTTFLAKLRREKFGSQKLQYGSLETWLKENIDIPLSDDQPFVISYDVNVNDEKPEASTFRFFVSTKRILRNAIGCRLIHCDATYKLIWQGFPVLTLGTTDSDRKFHPFGACVSTNERSEDFAFLFQSLIDIVKQLFDGDFDPEILIKDAADSIGNGYTKALPHRTKRENIIMCWAHLRRAVSKKLPEFLDTRNKMNFCVSILIFCSLNVVFFIL